MWHRDDAAFDEKLAATAAPAPSAGERRNRELRQELNERERAGARNHDLMYIGQERTGSRKLISTTRAKANAVPPLGLERLRVRNKGLSGALFSCCEDEHEEGSYCGFRKGLCCSTPTTRAIYAYFFDEPPGDNVDVFGRVGVWHSLPEGVRLVTWMDHPGCHQLDVF
jgi:hypothetical protein